MAKLVDFTPSRPGPTRWRFWCPGCGTHHWFRTLSPQQPDGSGIWSWNGDVDRPTVSPSIVCSDTGCHLFVRNGELVYLSDCKHALAGKTVPMEDID